MNGFLIPCVIAFVLLKHILHGGCSVFVPLYIGVSLKIVLSKRVSSMGKVQMVAARRNWKNLKSDFRFHFMNNFFFHVFFASAFLFFNNVECSPYVVHLNCVYSVHEDDNRNLIDLSCSNSSKKFGKEINFQCRCPVLFKLCLLSN